MYIHNNTSTTPLGCASYLADEIFTCDNKNQLHIHAYTYTHGLVISQYFLSPIPYEPHPPRDATIPYLEYVDLMVEVWATHNSRDLSHFFNPPQPQCKCKYVCSIFMVWAPLLAWNSNSRVPWIPPHGWGHNCMHATINSAPQRTNSLYYHTHHCAITPIQWLALGNPCTTQVWDWTSNQQEVVSHLTSEGMVPPDPHLGCETWTVGICFPRYPWILHPGSCFPSWNQVH